MASSTGQGRPLVYKTPPEAFQLGKFGGYLSGKKMKGYSQLLKIYEERLTTDEWELPLNYLQNGYTTINTDSLTF